MIDLDAYLARIGLSGPLAPTLATLHAITAAHVEHIPFENVDVILGRPIGLEPAELEAQLVRDRRGGYCFQQNGLLLEVLQQLGFDAVPLSGRVRYQQPRSYTPPRTHVFLKVTLDGEPWLADVGVGGNSMTSAIRLEVGLEQETPHEPRRIIQDDGIFYNQVFFGGEWHDVYEFTGEQMPFIDRVVASWWTSANPGSHFKARLTAARALPDGARMTLLNRTHTVRHRDGTADVREAASPEELLDVLREGFGIDLPAGTELPTPGLVWD